MGAYCAGTAAIGIRISFSVPLSKAGKKLGPSKFLYLLQGSQHLVLSICRFHILKPTSDVTLTFKVKVATPFLTDMPIKEIFETLHLGPKSKLPQLKKK